MLFNIRETAAIQAIHSEITALHCIIYDEVLWHTRFCDYQLHLLEMLISPIRVYARVEMTADTGVSAERCDEVKGLWMWNDILKGEGDDKPYTSSGGSSGYLENAEYSGDDSKLRIIDETKPTRFMIEFEFLTRESYPDTFNLTNGVDSLRIPNEVPVNN